jgi:hypothetical protein
VKRVARIAAMSGGVAEWAEDLKEAHRERDWSLLSLLDLYESADASSLFPFGDVH